MANTTWIKNSLEPYVRVWLSQQFPGHTFAERKVSFSSGGEHAFDAVSEDASIVAHILSNRAMTVSGNENNGGLRKALNDVMYLRLVTATTKLMVFTDAKFMDLVHRRAATKGGLNGILMMLCPLPIDMAHELRDMLDEASGEQRSRSPHA